MKRLIAIAAVVFLAQFSAARAESVSRIAAVVNDRNNFV